MYSVDAAQLSSSPALNADAVADLDGASKMPANFSCAETVCTQVALRRASARASASSCSAARRHSNQLAAGCGDAGTTARHATQARTARVTASMCHARCAWVYHMPYKRRIQGKPWQPPLFCTCLTSWLTEQLRGCW